MANKWYHKVTFYTIFVSVLLIFSLKLVLLNTRYGITASSINCHEQSAEDSNQTTAIKTKVNHEYIFTVIMYVIVNVLRIVEYLLLGKQFYIFCFQQEEVDPCNYFKKHSKRFCYLLLFFIILLPYFMLGFAIPGVGIYQELEHTQRLPNCHRHYHEIFIAYCAVNFLRYASAFTVRMVMIYTTLYVDKVWFPEPDGPPLHTSMGLAKLHRRKKYTAGESRADCGERTDSHTETSRLDTGDGPNMKDGNTNTNTGGSVDSISRDDLDVIHTSNEDQHQVEAQTDCTYNNEFFQKVLKDWKEVSKDFQQRSEKYHKIGKEVQIYQELFQTWFIVPWVIYFINTSLKTYHVLRPWNADGDGDTPLSNIPSIYYLLFNIIQFMTLIIPFLCVKKINTYHQKYFKFKRHEQLKQYEDDPSRLSFARQLMVEKNGRYDFEPRILGTSITISVGNPLFVVLLLVGLFFSISESLLK